MSLVNERASFPLKCVCDRKVKKIAGYQVLDEASKHVYRSRREEHVQAFWLLGGPREA